MRNFIAIGAMTLALLTSCAQEEDVSETSFSDAGFLKKGIVRNLHPGTPAADVESYLREHDVLEISYSPDRRTLKGARPKKLERLFPPATFWSIRVECALDASAKLQACTVAQSPEKCCGQ